MILGQLEEMHKNDMRTTRRDAKKMISGQLEEAKNMIWGQQEQAIAEAWVPIHLRVDVFLEANFLSLKKVVFRCFILKNRFTGQTVDFRL